MRDAFEVPGKEGPHQCLIYDPLGVTFSELRLLYDGKLPADMLKSVINYLLLALDFLHTEAGVVHTGKLSPPYRVSAPNSIYLLPLQTFKRVTS